MLLSSLLSQMMIRLPHFLLTCGLAIGAPVLAAPTIETMRVRDRNAKPTVELQAWSGFAAQIDRDGGAPPLLQAEIQSRLAMAHYKADQPDKGLAAAEAAEALVLRYGLGDAPFLPLLKATRALLLVELKQLVAARRAAEDAVALAARLPDAEPGAEADAYESLSRVAHAEGQAVEARDLACRAARAAEARLPQTDSRVAGNLMVCGIFGYRLDDDGAFEIMRRAAAIAYAKLPPDNSVVAQSLNGSGGVLLQTGRYAEAEAVFRRELEIERAVYGPDTINAYYPLPVLGRALEAQGKLEEAEAVLRGALAVALRLPGGGDPDILGNAYGNLARILEQRGRLRDALAEQERGLTTLRKVLPPTHRSIAEAEQGWARLQGRLGRVREALPVAARAAGVLEATLGVQHRGTIAARIDYALLLSRAGRHDEAQAIAARAAALLEEKLLDLATRRSELVSLSQAMTRRFGDVALIALRAGDVEGAVRAAQLATLSELALANAELGAQSLGRARGLAPLVDALRRARERQRQLQADLARVEADGRGDAVAVGIALRQATADGDVVQQRIAVEFPAFLALSRPRPLAMADLMSRLDAAEALILPLALTDGIATLGLTRERAYWAQADGDPARLQGAAGRVRASIDAHLDGTRPPFDRAAATELYRLLLPGDLGAQLADRRRWLFPASGPAAMVPPQLLLVAPSTDSVALRDLPWLIRRHAVGIVTDFTGASRASVGSRGPLRLLGVGAPEPAVVAMAPLSGAVDELRQMAAALSGAEHRILYGTRASERELRKALAAPVDVLVFATHGLVGGETEAVREPSLVLAATGTSADEDGLLTAGEIALLPLSAQWVVLSACDSAAGRRRGAPAYGGLARAFRAAGAGRLLLSHWLVRDDAAARLTVETLRRSAAGTDGAEALQAAMLDFMARTDVPDSDHPANWAPFVIVDQ